MVDTEINALTLDVILFNKLHSYAGHVVNFMVLIAKQLIYANKCRGKKTKF